MITTINDLPEPVLVTIFSLLDARELSRVSGVCTLWRALCSKDSQANRLWRKFYSQRWKVSCHDGSASWHSAYGTKLQSMRAWAGRNRPGWLHGHASGVRCCKLLPSHNLLATGSLDKTVRLWDVSSGIQLSISKPHGGTVRCLAIDQGCLATGCSDHNIRVWLAAAGAGNSRGVEAGGNEKLLFQVDDAADLTLRGHTGPVSAMCLTEGQLWTGSWDYSVRVWGRHESSWECRSVLTFDDWVGSLAVRGPHLMVAAGSSVSVLDTQTGQIKRKFQDLHEGHVSCLEGSQNGRLMFTGSSDGLVLVHDLRMREGSHVLWHHSAGVQGLSYEDPWLATASADGTVVILNTEGCMHGGVRPGSAASSSSSMSMDRLGSAFGSNGHGSVGPRHRQFQTSGSAYCVDLADQYLVAGSENSVVRVWDFTGAQEAAARAAAAKLARNKAREKNGGGAGPEKHMLRAANSGGAGSLGRQPQVMSLPTAAISGTMPAAVAAVVATGGARKGRSRSKAGKQQHQGMQGMQEHHQQQQSAMQLSSSPPSGGGRGGRRGGQNQGQFMPEEPWDVRDGNGLVGSPPGQQGLTLPATCLGAGGGGSGVGESLSGGAAGSSGGISVTDGQGSSGLYQAATGPAAASVAAAARAGAGHDNAGASQKQAWKGRHLRGNASGKHGGRTVHGPPQPVHPLSRSVSGEPGGSGSHSNLVVLGPLRGDQGFTYRYVPKGRGPGHH